VNLVAVAVPIRGRSIDRAAQNPMPVPVPDDDLSEHRPEQAADAA